MSLSKIKCTMDKLGPGLLYAGAAIGVSHLVQSTRAGAQFGNQLIIAIVLANLLKYPFFQIGPRYTAATGKTLLDGYAKLGKWAIFLFLFLTLGTMFTVQSAVTVVTAGLLEEVVGLNYDIRLESTILLSICAAILVVGRYSILDKLIKVIIIVLSISTVFSVGGTIVHYTPPMSEVPFDFSNAMHITFLVALIGWMPAPLDISVWHSMWSEAKNRDMKTKVSMKDAMLDFNIGFVGTMVLAICFLLLGSLVMYGRGMEFPSSAAAFAGQLIKLYTQSLGSWTYPIIAVACLTTMFSTTLTCLDAFPRMLRKITTQLIPHKFDNDECKKVYSFWVIVTAIGTSFTLYTFLQNMKAMVDFATILSFVVAPVVAILNYLVIQDKEVPAEARLTGKMKIFSWIGFVFLAGFSLYFLWFRFLG
jgi:Mn2+/Fe2+ NRAMP family transporter